MVDMLLTMICMIPKVNLGVGEIVFIRFSIINLQLGYKFDEFALTSFFPRRQIQFSEFKYFISSFTTHIFVYSPTAIWIIVENNANNCHTTTLSFV